MHNRLESILERVNGWLKFAESKNAAILTLALGVSGIVCTFLVNDDVAGELKIILGYSLFPLAVSALLAIASFFPILCIFSKLNIWNDQIEDNDNLLFFGDIAKYRVETYVIEVNKKYGLDVCNCADDKYAHDLATQCVINSKIALAKFCFFKYSIYSFFVAVLLHGYAILEVVL